MNRDGSLHTTDGWTTSVEPLPALRVTHPEDWSRWWHLKSDPTLRFFHGLLLAHIVLWSILPMLMHHNPSRETLQLLTLGRQWAWGYHQQAPLPAWLAIASCSLTGTAVWPTYVLGAVAGAVCLWCAWRLGREFLQPWTAVCAAVAMEACLYFNYTVPVLSSETLGRTCWAMAVLAFYWALRTGRRTHWVQTAICLGLGLLCRYDTIFLIGGMLLFTFWNDRARKCWDTSRPFLALGVMSAVVAPHLLWVATHVKGMDMTMMEYLVASEQVVETTSHPLVQILALLPVWFVLSPLVNWFNPPEETQDTEREFIKRYLVWASCLPPAVMAAIAIVNQRRVDALWMSPLWTYGGVLFVLWSKLDESRVSWRRALVWTGTACGLIAGVSFATYALFPPNLEDGCEVHFPGESLAQYVSERWANSFPGRELQVIGGDYWLAGNAAWFSSGHPYVYANLDSNESPNMRDERLRDIGGVVILDAATDTASAMQRIQQISPNAIALTPQELPWQHTAVSTAPVKVQLVMIPPFSVVKEAEEQALKAAGLGGLLPSASSLAPSGANTLVSPAAYDPSRSTIPIRANVPQPQPVHSTIPRTSLPPQQNTTAPAQGTTSQFNAPQPVPSGAVNPWATTPANSAATAQGNPFVNSPGVPATGFSAPIAAPTPGTPAAIQPVGALAPSLPTPTASGSTFSPPATTVNPFAAPTAPATQPFSGSTIPQRSPAPSVNPANNGTLGAPPIQQFPFTR